MKEETLFEIIGQIKPAYIAAAQRHRSRPASSKRQKYTAEPAGAGGYLRWLVPTACALTVLAAILLVPRPHKGDTATATGFHTAVQSVDFTQTEAETTRVDLNITAATPYDVVFKTAADYWALREIADLPDDFLDQLLQSKQYTGIDSRERLTDFLNDTQALPIPILSGETPEEIRIKESDTAAIFTFSNFTMEVAKQADKAYAEQKTRHLSKISDYQSYPLYIGSDTVANGIAYLELYMNANGYLVRITAETDNAKTFVNSLEGLTFYFPDCTTPADIYSGEGETFKWVFSEDTGVLTFSPLRKNARVYGYMVYGEAPWHSYAEKITSVVVEEGIVALDNRSITQLPALQSVQLPESLTSIGDEVFSNCCIETLVIPASVTDIGTSVAANCPKLRTVDITAWQPNIAQEFLANCPVLEKITTKNTIGYWQQIVIPANPHLVDVPVECVMDTGYDFSAMYDENGVIWSYQKESCTLTIQGSGLAGAAPAGILPVWEQVRSVVISEGITGMTGSLAEMASLQTVSLPSTLETMISFFGCENLENITVPEGIRELPASTFQNCAKLKTAVLPEGLKTIRSMAFGGCCALDNIRLPNSINWIDGTAFWGCTSLKEVRLPDSLRRLKSGTFQNCTQLHTVTLPKGLADIEPNCFDGCTSLRVLNHLGTQAERDELYERCADAIPERVLAELAAQTQDHTQKTSADYTLLWGLIPLSVAAAVTVFTIIIIRKKGTDSTPG